MEKSNVFATLKVGVRESEDDATAHKDKFPSESLKQVNSSHLLK